MHFVINRYIYLSVPIYKGMCALVWECARHVCLLCACISSVRARCSVKCFSYAKVRNTCMYVRECVQWRYGDTHVQYTCLAITTICIGKLLATWLRDVGNYICNDDRGHGPAKQVQGLNWGAPGRVSRTPPIKVLQLQVMFMECKLCHKDLGVASAQCANTKAVTLRLFPLHTVSVVIPVSQQWHNGVAAAVHPYL